MKVNFLIVSLFVYCLGFSQVEEEKSNSVSSFLISAHYAPSFALGDLQKRYSFLNHIGAGVSYKLNSNWIFGIDGSFIFGNRTKFTGLFDNLVDSHGNISDVNGDVGIVLANPRGLTFNVHIGKIFPISKSNPNSGIFVRVSGGYLQHKLNIETRDHIIPSLEKEYRKGYDRFSSGLASEQLLGYLFIGNNEFVNFYAGAFIQEGFTVNRRNLNYDQPTVPVDKSLRLDMMVGIKVAWIFLANANRSRNYYTK
jgi:hypothetical protein